MFQDDSKFAVIYSLDEEDKWQDESCWGKANPNLAAGVVKIDYLREKVKAIENSPAELRTFLRYHCNRWSTAQEGHSLPPERVAACKGLKSDPLDGRQMAAIPNFDFSAAGRPLHINRLADALPVGTNCAIRNSQQDGVPC